MPRAEPFDGLERLLDHGCDLLTNKVLFSEGRSSRTNSRSPMNNFYRILDFSLCTLKYSHSMDETSMYVLWANYKEKSLNNLITNNPNLIINTIK